MKKTQKQNDAALQANALEEIADRMDRVRSDLEKVENDREATTLQIQRVLEYGDYRDAEQIETLVKGRARLEVIPVTKSALLREKQEVLESGRKLLFEAYVQLESVFRIELEEPKTFYRVVAELCEKDNALPRQQAEWAAEKDPRIVDLDLVKSHIHRRDLHPSMVSPNQIRLAAKLLDLIALPNAKPTFADCARVIREFTAASEAQTPAA